MSGSGNRDQHCERTHLTENYSGELIGCAEPPSYYSSPADVVVSYRIPPQRRLPSKRVWQKWDPEGKVVCRKSHLRTRPWSLIIGVWGSEPACQRCISSKVTEASHHDDDPIATMASGYLGDRSKHSRCATYTRMGSIYAVPSSSMSFEPVDTDHQQQHIDWKMKLFHFSHLSSRMMEDAVKLDLGRARLTGWVTKPT